MYKFFFELEVTLCLCEFDYISTRFLDLRMHQVSKNSQITKSRIPTNSKNGFFLKGIVTFPARKCFPKMQQSYIYSLSNFGEKYKKTFFRDVFKWHCLVSLNISLLHFGTWECTLQQGNLNLQIRHNLFQSKFFFLQQKSLEE